MCRKLLVGLVGLLSVCLASGDVARIVAAVPGSVLAGAPARIRAAQPREESGGRPTVSTGEASVVPPVLPFKPPCQCVYNWPYLPCCVGSEQAVVLPAADDDQAPAGPVDVRVVDPNECATAPVLTFPDPNAAVGIDILLPCTGTSNTNDPRFAGSCVGDGADPNCLCLVSDSEWIKVVVPAGRTIMHVDDCNAPAAGWPTGIRPASTGR